jgi:hypothetical protein
MSDQQTLDVFTIYRDPLDNPGRIVVRRFTIHANDPRADREPLYVGDSLDEARAHVPLGLICFTRDEGDDRAVVESWM